MNKLKEKIIKIAVEWAMAFVQTHISIDEEAVFISEPNRVAACEEFIAAHT